MDLTLGIAVFFMMWWIVLFAILPFWVRTPDAREKEDVHFAGAPAKSHLLKKFFVNTVVTAVLFSILYFVVEYQPFTLNDIPIGPRFGTEYK